MSLNGEVSLLRMSCMRLSAPFLAFFLPVAKRLHLANCDTAPNDSNRAQPADLFFPTNISTQWHIKTGFSHQKNSPNQHGSIPKHQPQQKPPLQTSSLTQTNPNRNHRARVRATTTSSPIKHIHTHPALIFTCSRSRSTGKIYGCPK